MLGRSGLGPNAPGSSERGMERQRPLERGRPSELRSNELEQRRRLGPLKGTIIWRREE